MKYYSHNGAVQPTDKAVISLFSIEFTYGFGVYETIRVSKHSVKYRDQHVERLLKSATIIGLGHTFTAKNIARFIDELAERVDEPAFNLKVLLIGGRLPKEANLYILPVQPRFPDRKLYAQGAHSVTTDYERYLPNAKTLNMLPSYLAYKKAQQAGAYDAILVNRGGEMLEGTMTNLFALKGKTLHTAPGDTVLEGVTRTNILECARKNGYKVVETAISRHTVKDFDTFFLSSTSTKIMPLKSIDTTQFEISEDLRNLMKIFSVFQDS